MKVALGAHACVAPLAPVETMASVTVEAYATLLVVRSTTSSANTGRGVKRPHPPAEYESADLFRRPGTRRVQQPRRPQKLLGNSRGAERGWWWDLFQSTSGCILFVTITFSDAFEEITGLGA